MSTQQPETLESLRSAYALGYIDATTYRAVRRALVAAIAQGARAPSPLAAAIQSAPNLKYSPTNDDSTVRPVTEVITAPPRRASDAETSGSEMQGGAAGTARADHASTEGSLASSSRTRSVQHESSARDTDTHTTASNAATRSKKPLLLGSFAVLAVTVATALLLIREPNSREDDYAQTKAAARAQAPEIPASIDRLVTRSEWTVSDIENARAAVRTLKPAPGAANGPRVLAGLRGAVQERVNLEAELARSGHRDTAFDEQLVALAKELDLSVDALTGSPDVPPVETVLATSVPLTDSSVSGSPPPASNALQAEDYGGDAVQNAAAADSAAPPSDADVAASAPVPSQPLPGKPATDTAISVASTEVYLQQNPARVEGHPPPATNESKSGTKGNVPLESDKVAAEDKASKETPAKNDQRPPRITSAPAATQANLREQANPGTGTAPQRAQQPGTARLAVESAPAVAGKGAETPPVSPTKPAATKGNCDEITLPSTSKSLASRPCADSIDGAPGPALSIIALRNSFRMGGNNPDELPVHDVALSRPFAIGKFEVSVKQYRRFASETGTPLRDQPANNADAPVVNVTWDEAVRYCKWLSQKTGASYRLPSEAEWEWAARAGEQTRWPGSDKDINAAAIHGSVLGKKSLPRSANMGPAPKPFGLVNMLGNIREWVLDGWQSGYDGAPLDGQPFDGSSEKVVRGGSFRSNREGLRLGAREKLEPSNFDDETGFRVVRDLVKR